MRRLAMGVVAGLVAALPALGQGQAPALLSYQGALIDASGAPITAASAVRFTLLWGGTATEGLSTGRPVYQEDATLMPNGRGLFHHLIGSGAPTTGCDENGDGTAAEACVLSPADFPGGGTVLYLELRLDPAGANNPLLPRQEMVSTAYAFNASQCGGRPAEDFITGVAAGAGLAGGGSTGDVMLAVGPGAITNSMLALNSVGTAQIINATVSSADLASSSVTTTQILNGTVGSVDLAPGAVMNANIALGAVNSASIFDGSVAAVDLAANSVGAEEIQAGAVTNPKLSLTTFTSSILNAFIADTTLDLGVRTFCALARSECTGSTSGNLSGCRVTGAAGAAWTLLAFSNGNVCNCQAVCF